MSSTEELPNLSVTRICEHFEGLFSIWQNFESTLSIFVCFWANVYCCEQPLNEKINLTSGHTVPKP